MIKKLFKLIIILLTIPVQGYSQDYHSSFEILNTPYNAPLMAMGGVNISWSGSDPAQFISNPALSNDSTNNYIAFNYLSFSSIYKGFVAAYNHSLMGGNVSVAARGISFGDIQGYDAAGNPTEVFKANQTVVTTGYQLSQGNFRYGANIDFTTSGIAGLRANAVSFSLGGLFYHPKKDLSMSLVIKNIGVVISDYSSTQPSKLVLPWDVQLGMSFKPEYMPFRFSLTGHHLFNMDLLSDNIDGSTFKEVFSHFVIGTELLISQNISLMAGYNHLIRQELKLEQTAGGAGFSYGFLWKTKRLTFGYGRGAYHIAGAAHLLSLNIDLNTFSRRI